MVGAVLEFTEVEKGVASFIISKVLGAKIDKPLTSTGKPLIALASTIGLAISSGLPK